MRYRWDDSLDLRLGREEGEPLVRLGFLLLRGGRCSAGLGTSCLSSWGEHKS